MHKSDSQFRIINEYLEEKINNPLVYREVQYERAEWDNIPMIIPRFYALTRHYKSKCDEESVSSLRASLTNDIIGVRNLIYTEKQESELKMNDLQEQIDALRKELKAFEAKLDEERIENLIKAKQIVTRAFVKDEAEQKMIEFESNCIQKVDYEKNLQEYRQPRQFSLLQIRELFFSLIHISKFRENFINHQEFFEIIKSQIHDQIHQIFEQQKQQDIINNDFQSNLDSQQNAYNDHVKEYYRILEHDHDQLTALTSKQKVILRELDDNKGFQEMVNSKFEKLLYRINNVNDKQDLRHEDTKIKMEQQTKLYDKKMVDMKDLLNNNIEVTKNHLYDQIEYAKEQLNQQIKQDGENFGFKLDELSKELNEKTQSIREFSKQKVVKIKSVCASFFKNYEDSLKKLKEQFQEVHDSFVIWNRNVVKPNQLNEATLYSLEQRVNNEEVQRINENILIKDVINKLIYSFHQHLSNTNKLTTMDGLDDIPELRSTSLKFDLNSPLRQSVFFDQKERNLLTNQQLRQVTNQNDKLLSNQLEERYNLIKAAKLLLIKRLLFLRQKLYSQNEKVQAYCFIKLNKI